MRAFVAFSAIQATVFLITTRYVVTHLYFMSIGEDKDPLACRGALLMGVLLAYGACLLVDVILIVVVLGRGFGEEHRAVWVILPGVAVAYLVVAIDYLMQHNADFPVIFDVVVAVFIVIASARFMYGVSKSDGEKHHNVATHAALAYGVALYALRTRGGWSWQFVVMFLAFDVLRVLGDFAGDFLDKLQDFTSIAKIGKRGTEVAHLVLVALLLFANNELLGNNADAPSAFVNAVSWTVLGIVALRAVYKYFERERDAKA